MSILVELRDEHGNVLERMAEWVGSPSFDLDSDDFPTLRYIDPYGNTVFNGLQMKPLIQEFGILRARASTDEQRRMVDRILAAAHRCAKSQHTYLAFVGD